ncbi:hypothetical protein QTG64_004390 [Vibrio vulnificus]|nr:hypothetical protein [Vibrio vulnificus]EHW0638024.1 hypothetical protein [Vibrio vulnificus]EHZ2652368.1 hypothetical protein [Vibrio vulnificus]EIU7554724.1 hypothetical protein [Vibrio vulnificus]EIX4880864.1 hypothetical protein [Vibrio vulnificus]
MSEASHTSKPNHKKNSLGSHVVGASSGTLVVVIANALPEGSATLKELLIHSAPTLTMISSAVFGYASYRVVKYFFEKERKAEISAAKAACQESLKNPVTSPEHKSKIRQSLEHIEQLEVEASLENVKAIMKKKAHNSL